MPASYLGRRRSRPVADAPALDGSEVAKAWLVELVAVAPLERAARLPGPRFADDAPRLCAAVAAALSSDAAHADLEPGGALAPLAAGAGHLAAAGGPAETVAALEALRAVVWSAVLEDLDRPVPAQVAELSDRLAAVVGTLTAAALESPHPLGPARPGDRGPLAAVLREAREADGGDEPSATGWAAGPRARARVEDVAPDDVGPEDTAPEHDAPDDVAGAADVGSDVERGDDRAPQPDAAPGPAPAPLPFRRRRGDAPARPPERGRPAADHVPPPAGGDATDRPPLRSVPSADERPPSASDALAQIEATLRDAANAADPLAEAAARLRALAQGDVLADPFDAAATRLRSEAPPLDEPRIRRMPAIEDATDVASARVTPWAASIERRLARHRGDGLPFAVLCLELTDADRLLAADVDRDVVTALEAAEAAVLAQLRPADALIRERPGRYWLTTPDTDAADARGLAHRIAAAIEELPPHRGAPLQVAIGVTSCPADAADAATLESRAEEGLFAARAAGQRVAGPPR